MVRHLQLLSLWVAVDDVAAVVAAVAVAVAVHVDCCCRVAVLVDSVVVPVAVLVDAVPVAVAVLLFMLIVVAAHAVCCVAAPV